MAGKKAFTSFLLFTVISLAVITIATILYIKARDSTVNNINAMGDSAKEIYAKLLTR